MMKFFRILLALIVTVAGIFILGHNALASDLPEVMVGQTTVTMNPGEDDQAVYYDGMGSNQVVLNFDDNVTTEFDRARIESCIPVLGELFILPDPRCFFITDEAKQPIKSMVSRTYRSGATDLETAAILYDPNIILGDAYSKLDPDNFAFYGRNLNQTSSGSGPYNGSWNATDYTFNPEAQSSFTDQQLEYQKNRVKILAGEAQILRPSDLNGSPNWYLQGSDIYDNSNGDATKFPEGKVWLVQGPLNLSGNSITEYTYRGKGTIILLNDRETETADLVLENVKIKAGDNSSLGLIVATQRRNNATGDLEINTNLSTLDFKGNNTIEAAVLVFGDITRSASGAIRATGSFVARDFRLIQTGITGFIEFYYNDKLDKNWPPGFRYFNMPHSSNDSPN